MGRDHTGTFTEKIKRQVYLDKLRVLATVLVIAVHTVSLGSTLVPERSAVWYGFEISNYLFLCCNLLFIMISGALLLPVKDESAGQFYRKRFLKVLVPMVIYYILYVCAKEGFVCFSQITGSHVKTYSARCTGGSAAFLADLCDHLVICADTVFPLCGAAYSGFCFKRACGCDPDLPDPWNLLGYALL